MEAAFNLPFEEEKQLTPQQELEEMKTFIQEEYMALSKKAFEFSRRSRKKQEITADEEFEQTQRWKYVKQMEKAYTSLYKIVYPKGSKAPGGGEAKPDMAKVTSMKSSVGAIVRDIPVDLTKSNS